LNDNLDPMIYPLMFPYTDLRWNIKFNSENYTMTKLISPLQYYSFKLQIRGNFNPCINLKKLSQQYVVDAYAKVEKHRLNYIKTH